jgi:hypothetical protein
MAEPAITPETTIDARILNVYDALAGSTLAVDATAGDSELILDDLFDFDEAGGTVQISDGTNTESVGYTSVDDDTATLTLSGPLAHSYAVTDGTFATPDPDGLEKRAQIIRGDVDDELIEARVLHRWYDVLPEGIRDPDSGEAVTAAFDGTDWVITDILGQTPFIDGSLIDDTSLPPPATSDGAPPSASPTANVVGGIGTLFVSWIPLTNHDPVTYNIHISTTSGFTPDWTTLSQQVEASQAVIRTMPAGSPLDYATTYYVQIVAEDTDGAAAAGIEASGSPAQVTGPDIAVEAVTADKIVANSITADQIASVTDVSGTFETATEGQRVVFDPSGIHLYDADGNELVSIPTDDSKSPTFRGDIITDALTVLDRMLIQGADNEMDKGAQLTLNAQLASPGAAPALAFEYDTDVFDAQAVIACRGLDYSATGGVAGDTACYYTVAQQEGNWDIYEIDASTMAVLRTGGGRLTANIDYLGVVQLGAYVWTLWQNTSTGTIHLDAYALSGGLFTTASSTTLALGTVTNHGAALGTDGTNLLIASWSGSSSTSRPTISTYSVSGATATPTSSSPTSGAGGATYGSGTRYITAVNARQASTICLVTEDRSSSQRVTSFELYDLGTLAKLTSDGNTWCPDSVISGGNSVLQSGGGVAYDGSRYHSIRRIAPTIVNYSGWVWTAGTDNDIWWVGYQWYASAGPSHTKLSPLSSVQLNGASPSIGRGSSGQVAMRGQIRAISPSVPSDADDTQVYMLPASSSPTITSMKLQSPFAHTDGAGSYTQYIDGYASAGAAYVDSNTFPGGGTSKIVSSGGVTAGWELGGDDTIVLPRSTVLQRPSAPAKSDLRFNEDRGQVEVYLGSVWGSVGAEIVQETFSIASVAAGTSGSQTVPISGLQVGDVVVWAGAATNTALVIKTNPVCTTAGQITLFYANPDSTGHAVASTAHTFLIYRRS